MSGLSVSAFSGLGFRCFLDLWVRWSCWIGIGLWSVAGFGAFGWHFIPGSNFAAILKQS